MAGKRPRTREPDRTRRRAGRAEVMLEDLPPRIGEADSETAADDGYSYRHSVDAAKSDIIKRVLAHYKGNRAASARALGLHKTHPLNLMKTPGIE